MSCNPLKAGEIPDNKPNILLFGKDKTEISVLVSFVLVKSDYTAINVPRGEISASCLNPNYKSNGRFKVRL